MCTWRVNLIQFRGLIESFPLFSLAKCCENMRKARRKLDFIFLLQLSKKKHFNIILIESFLNAIESIYFNWIECFSFTSEEKNFNNFSFQYEIIFCDWSTVCWVFLGVGSNFPCTSTEKMKKKNFQQSKRCHCAIARGLISCFFFSCYWLSIIIIIFYLLYLELLNRLMCEVNFKFHFHSLFLRLFSPFIVLFGLFSASRLC